MAEWRVCDNSDAQLTRHVEQLDLRRLDRQGEWRVYHLHCGDGVDGVSAAEGCGAALGKSAP
jgi:hypothetical protein